MLHFRCFSLISLSFSNYSFTQPAYLFIFLLVIRSGANIFLKVMNGELLSCLKIKLCFECLLEIELKLYLRRFFCRGIHPSLFFSHLIQYASSAFSLPSFSMRIDGFIRLLSFRLLAFGYEFFTLSSSRTLLSLFVVFQFYRFRKNVSK